MLQGKIVLQSKHCLLFAGVSVYAQNKLNDALEMLGSLAVASGMTFLQKLNCASHSYQLFVAV